MKKIMCFFLLFATLHLVGCMPFKPLKAPCDYRAAFCGKKIKINPDT